jgi:cytochrome c-type biogenesis protein CcmH
LAVLLYAMMNQVSNIRAWKVDQTKQLRLQQAEQILKKYPDHESIIRSLRQRLDQQPQSAQGWYLLGRLYAANGQWAQALHAYQTAARLKPSSERYQVEYLMSLWQVDHQTMSPKARAQWKKLLLAHPHQAQALMMLAMDAFRHQHFQQAIFLWSRLLQLVPPNSEDAQMIQQAMDKAQQQEELTHRTKK